MNEEKVWTHKEWDAICPSCSTRRFLWPANQDVNSLSDPKAKFIHGNGKEECQ